MSIIIIGNDGYIARHLIEYLRGKKYNVKCTSRKKKQGGLFLDLFSPQDFDYRNIQPGDTIIHLAAISSPDICKNQYEQAYKVNVEGSAFFIKSCLQRGARVLFFSSDTVYGANRNESEFFNETSECHPLGEYGYMKYLLEQIFVTEARFKVIRPSYVFSKDDKFTQYMKNCSQQKKSAQVFHPFFRNVIYLKDLCIGMEVLIKDFDKIPQRIFNMCGTKAVSRKNIAEWYQKIVDPSFEFSIIKPEKEFFQARPQYLLTQSLYLEKLLKRKPFDILEAMKLEFLSSI